MRTVRRVHRLSAAIAVALVSAKASAQVLYEPFNYTVGTSPLDTTAAGANKNYTSSGTYWSSRATNATNQFTVQTGLTGPSNAGVILPAPMGGTGQEPTANSQTTPVIGFGQTFTTDGDYYFSFELKLPTTGLVQTDGTFGGLANFSIPAPTAVGGFQSGFRYIHKTTSTYQLALAGNGTGATTVTDPTVLNGGQTVFVVERYHINSAARNDDTLSMWVNPTAGFGNNGSIPTPDVTAINGTNGDSVDAVTNAPMLAAFTIRSFGSTAGWQFDELRVDSTWAGVTPNGNLQYTWNNAGGGTLSDTTKWTTLAGAPSASPNGSGHVANFGTGIASGSTITSAGETLDTISITNAGSLTIGGTGITFSSPASAAQIDAYAGTHTISAPITMSSNLSLKTQGTGTVLNIGNTITGTKTLGIYGTGTVKMGGSNLIDPTARLEAKSGTLDLNGGSQTVATLQLGTSHPNNGSAIARSTFYDGDLASGTIANGTITAGAYDLQSGNISATIAGTNGITKNLSGVVTFSGTNTYTGTTAVAGGVLLMTSANTNSNPVHATLATAVSVVGGTTTLLLNSDANLGTTGGTVAYAATAGGSGTLQFGTNMTLAADRTITADANLSRLAAPSGVTAFIDAAITSTTTTGGINITYPWDPTVSSSGTSDTAVVSGALSPNAGVIVLRNTTNNYQGSTTVSGGRLLLPNNSVAPGFATAGKYVTVAPPTFPASSDGAILSVGVGGTGEWASTDIDTLLANATLATGTFFGFDTANATAPVTYASNMSGNEGIAKYSAGTLSLPGNLSQAGGVNVNGGTLIMGGNNSYAGQTNVAGGATLRITSSNALGASSPTPGARTVIGGGSAADANSTLQIDGSAGNISTAEPFTLTGKTSAGSGNPTAHIENVAGDNTVSGLVSFSTGGSWYNITSTAGNLNVLNVDNPQTGSTQRVLNLRGAGNGTLGTYSNTGAGTDVRLWKFDSGTWTVNGPVSHTGSTIVNGGNLVFNTNLTTSSNVTVTAGALKLANNGTHNQIIHTGAVSVTSGQIDLADNKLVTTTAAGSATAGVYTAGTVQGMVQAGRAGGAWSGSGIVTSEPNAQGGSSLTTLAVAVAGDIGKTTLDGQAVNTTDTLVMYTYAGDMNLDGQINGDDYFRIDAGFAAAGNGYENGDLNYDGRIDADDYFIMDRNYVRQTLGVFPSAAPLSLGAVAAVPEPASMGVMLLAAGALAARRRRR